MIRCIIVDDEILAQDVIKNHLQHFSGWQLAGVCRNAAAALEILNREPIDVMFLDIRMPGMSGLQLLRDLPATPLVVLTTAYAEYAVTSYEFSVIDYLLKPISLHRFTKAINRIENDRLFTFPEKPPVSPTANHIFIRSNSKFFKVRYAEIVYIEGMKDYLKIHTPEYSLVTHQTMNEFEKSLPPTLFLRIHKSYIVAIDHIRAVFGNSVELAETTIPIGINYKEQVMNLIGRR